MKINEKIKQLRLLGGFSQANIAKKLYITESLLRYRKWENKTGH